MNNLVESIRSKLVKVAAVREAGRVRRCHAIPHHGQYNIAEHCYGAVSLLLILNPDADKPLIRAVLWHDTAERWLGDLPGPAKGYNPELGEIYEATEKRILKALQLWPGLSKVETDWLRFVDIMDLWMWCRTEANLGNLQVRDMEKKCTEVIQGIIDEGRLNEEAAMFFEHVWGTPETRLPDDFRKVEPWI